MIEKRSQIISATVKAHALVFHAAVFAMAEVLALAHPAVDQVEKNYHFRDENYEFHFEIIVS